MIARERGWVGGRRGGRTGGAAQFVRGSYKSFKGLNLTELNLCVETMHSFKGINVTVLEKMHQFIMHILFCRTTSE